METTLDPPNCEPTEHEHAQIRIMDKFRELRAYLEKPKSEISNVQAAAKITALAAMVEEAKDVAPFVWKAVDAEMRVAAFQIVLGVIASALEQ